jgi:hypothetical protein
MRLRSALSLSALTLLLACNQKIETAPAVATSAAVAAAVPAKAAESAPVAAAPAEHDCALGAGTELANDKVVTSKTTDGKTLQHAGAQFSDGVAVTTSELLAAPDKYAGKKVRVKGNVSAMCMHARAWFALAADDQSGRFVRVMTAPNFLVPNDSIGKSAETEGVVEVTEVAPEQAKHIAGEHKLGDPAAITGPVKQVIIRATGAAFIG